MRFTELFLISLGILEDVQGGMCLVLQTDQGALQHSCNVSCGHQKVVYALNKDMAPPPGQIEINLL